MNIGESLIVGRMGNQPLPIADVSVSPQHVKITRTTSTDYQIEDLDSAKGVFVFGFRVQLKTIKDNTKRLFTYFVSFLCDTDSTFSSCERLMTC